VDEQPFDWELDELAAAIAVLSRENVRSTKSVAALRDAMERLKRPDPLAAQTLGRLGIEPLDRYGRLRPLAEILEQLGRADPDNNDLRAIFGVQAAGPMGGLYWRGAATLRGLTGAMHRSPDRERLLADTKRLLLQLDT
jgi:TP901 family phage tail tape measure protein